jgi:translation initiation factor 3 subunit A
LLPLKKVQDRKFWEQLESERIQEAVAEREVAVQHRERLARMKADKDVFLEKLKAERKTVYQVSPDFILSVNHKMCPDFRG